MSEQNSENGPLFPTWEALKSDFIDRGLPGVCVVRVDPHVAMFVDERGARFGALVAWSGEGRLPTSPWVEICVSLVSIRGVRLLEVATASRLLYRDFYLLLGEFITAIVRDNAPPIAALEAALSRWQALMRLRSLLNPGTQVGLFGELWMLERLSHLLGAETVSSWVGPTGHVHDFRYAHYEFEVKTTTTTPRRHIINGISQLDPSADCQLFLLSVHITDAGAGGYTLGDMVAFARAALVKADADIDRFDNLLEGLGFRGEDQHYYSSRRRIGSAPRLIRVEHGVPRLTPDALQLIPDYFSPHRIREVTYEIDVDGLGVADGDPTFLDVLPIAHQ